MKRKRVTVLLIIALLILTAAFPFLTIESNANAVDELTIRIGYYGWSPDEYIEKAVFTASDLYDMGAVDSNYTYWDGSRRVAIDSSYGVPVAAILDAAGIDQSSVSNLDFWTADSGNGAFTSFTWKQLIGTKRYYFEDLASFFSFDDNGNIVCDTDGAWKNAIKVQPVMSLEENWTWYEVGTSDAAGTDNLGTANRFRLNFGQTDPMEQRTFNSAKMVHTIYVMFSGSPILTSDETNIDGKVGSSHSIKITAAAADEALEEKIQSGIVWSSSDSSVVEVDDSGNLTYTGEGTATIYAESGGVTKEFVVTVGGEEVKPEDPGTGSGSGNGDGNGNGNGGGDGDGNTSGRGKTVTKPGNNTSAQASSEKEKVQRSGSKAFILSERASNDLRLALNRTAHSEKASMSTHQSEMDPDAEQLKVKKQDDKGLGRALAAINGMIALEGSLFGVIRYRKQRWG